MRPAAAQRQMQAAAEVDLVLHKDAEQVIAGIIGHLALIRVVGGVRVHPVVVEIDAIHQTADRGLALELQIDAECRQIHIIELPDAIAADAELLLGLRLQGNRQTRGLNRSAEVLAGQPHVGKAARLVKKPRAIRRGGHRIEGALERGVHHRRVRAPHIILAALLMHRGQHPVIVQAQIEARIESPLLIAGAGLPVAVAVHHIAELAQRDAEMKPPFLALPQTRLKMLHMTVLRAAPPIRGQPVRKEGALRLAEKAAAFGQSVHRAADRITAVKHRALGRQQFHALQRERIDERPVLIRAVAEGAVVVADAIHHHQRAEAGEATDEGRSLPVRGLLDRHARRFTQRFGEGARQALIHLLFVEFLHRRGHLRGFLRAARRGHHRVGQRLSGQKARGGEKGENQAHRPLFMPFRPQAVTAHFGRIPASDKKGPS